MSTQPQETINRAPSKPVAQFSNFRESLPYGFGNSYRFGEIGVHYFADAVKSENGKFMNSHDLRSYTLPKPLMQNFWMRKTYGFIPLSAILPLNYEKYSNIPNRGEDVNSELVGTTVVGFIGKVQAFLASLFTRANDATLPSYEERFASKLRFVIMYDMFMSRGSLFKSLGITIPGTLSTPDNDVDAFYNDLSGIVAEYPFKLSIRGKSWYVGSKSNELGIGHISLREAISRMRDDLSFTIDSAANYGSFLEKFESGFFSFSALDSVNVDSAPVNLERFYAYQLFCAHFFSNDHVDSLYTAELWRQNLYSLLRQLIGNAADSMFLYNGVNYHYDTCSAYMMQQVFLVARDLSEMTSSQIGLFCDYFRLIFGFNRSLRFGDYFTGSRTLPLAPGDVTVEVNGTSFSVVESIKKSWYARLLAQIQRVGRRTSAQSKALYPDVNTVQDWHEPIWLGETTSSVWSEEVDNTGSDQFNPDKPISTSAVLRSKQDTLAFEVRVPDREGVILGFTWFDIPRYYANATDRSFFAISRFDKFNPYLQFNGDQPIYRKELTPDSHTLEDEYFGYTGRYMEYKQRYNICAGAFADNTVPGLLFLADEGKDYVDIENLSSDYIRSYPSELDKFYLSLSGWSLGHYFHFLVINQNDYDGNKPMAFNPTLD